MHNHEERHWPQFELVSYTDVLALNDIANDAMRKSLKIGVPKSFFGAYKADSNLSLLNIPSRGKLICFSSSDLTKLCLDTRTSEVVHVITVPDGPCHPVNETLEQYRQSVKAVYDRFPFDSWQPGMSPNSDEIMDMVFPEWEMAADELRAILHDIDRDPAVSSEIGFWGTFLDDLMMGNYFSKDVMFNPEYTAE